jgi:transposase-like protein
MNLIDLMAQFGDESKCREYLEHLRWPDGVACPKCGSLKCYYTSTRQTWECDDCGYHFSVTSGTMLHDTHLPLQKWIVAVYLMIESPKGMSAMQIKRSLNVAYQTSWYLCHRIRAAIRESYPFPLKGLVEVDETFVGGKTQGKGRGYKGNKAVVVGAVQREGCIALQVVTSRDRETLHQFIKEHISDETVAIFTDEWPAYRGIGDENTRHETVNHSLEEYVRGDVHVNSAEGVWSLFKRSIIGSYHKLIPIHSSDAVKW